MAGTRLIRGRVYGAVLSNIEDEGEKYYLVVSNNRRNGAFPQVLAVRLTTTPVKSPRPRSWNSIIAKYSPAVQCATTSSSSIRMKSQGILARSHAAL